MVVSVEPADGPGRYMEETAAGEPGYVGEKRGVVCCVLWLLCGEVNRGTWGRREDSLYRITLSVAVVWCMVNGVWLV